MSSDIKALTALALKTGHAMRYFELVVFVNGTSQRKCFIGFGKHALFFMRLNWDHQIHEGGEIPYAFIQKVVVDVNSRTHIMLYLSENRPAEWGSERLYIDSEQRNLFLRHLRCSWQTDFMWRIGKVSACPVTTLGLTTEIDDLPEVMPFRGWRWREFQDYKFMIPGRFVDQAGTKQKTPEEQLDPTSDTGEFLDPLKEDGTGSGSSLMVHVHEQLTLDQTKCLKLDHIRWVAMTYKLNLLKDEKQFYVLRNSPYQKRMNLAGDIASWVCWEMIIRTEEVTLIVMLLRRQYLPPVFNNVQDIVLIVRLPQSAVRDAKNPAKFFNGKVREAHLMADSLMSCQSTFSVYNEIVQTKLDTLRFDDEGFAWVLAYLKLSPRWRREGKMFIRALLAMYIKDGAIEDPDDILNRPAADVIINGDAKEAWGELKLVPDLEKFFLDMRNAVHSSGMKDPDYPNGLPDIKTIPEGRTESSWKKECNIVLSNWHLRVARYFAWAVDGGMVSSFDIERLIQGFQVITEANYRIASSVLEFLLHIRSRDMSKIFDGASIISQLKGSLAFDNNLPYDRKGSENCLTFNENVMMQLLRTDYVRKTLFNGKNAEYFGVLGKFLKQGCGVDLKAYICRTFMDSCGTPGITTEIIEVMISPLIHLLGTGGAFLATYASAALVNASHGNDLIKTHLMTAGITTVCCTQLKAKDDDLVCYIFMLIVNLTKEPHHRSIIMEQGLLGMLYDTLTSSYTASASATSGAAVLPGSNVLKVKILTQVCIIIGQFCNEPAFRKRFQKDFEHTTSCLVYICVQTKAATTLASKAMFALKQLCVGHNRYKLYICSYVATKLVEEIFDENLEKVVDFYNQGILLLQALTTHPECIQRLDSAGLTSVRLQALKVKPEVRKDNSLVERIDNLEKTMAYAIDRFK